MNKVAKIFIYLVLILTSIGMIVPMLLMVFYSLKEYPEGKTLVQLLTSDFTLKNYIDAFKSDRFDIYFFNSILVASIVTLSNLLFCLMVGYALARWKTLTSRILFSSVIAVLFIPSHVIMIPLYKLMVELGWINTYFALIVPWLVTPFGIFLVRQYILNLPTDIEDAARIDGASEWQILFSIVAPLAKPILFVLGIYTFLSNWNSFLFPFLFTNEESFRTLPVGLAFYLGKQSIDWGHLFAGAAISGLPIIILFIIFQKQIIRGLTSGALKE
ncbi:MAG: carbohydrate ABC transporter permease [Ignavibacteria bacterium]|nr:carbohydrate ABC transporter permease [Ignavibacteria bacterium]